MVLNMLKFITLFKNYVREKEEKCKFANLHNSSHPEDKKLAEIFYSWQQISQADRRLSIFEFIDDECETGNLVSKDCELFPFSRRILNKNGAEMVVVYFDTSTNLIRWIFPK
jgi:hypothetical protein